MKEDKVRNLNKIRLIILYIVAYDIIWFLYFIFQILADNANSPDNDKLFSFMRNGPGSWIFISLISFRQFIFTFLFFFTQGNLRKHAYNLITCKAHKEKKPKEKI